MHHEATTPTGAAILVAIVDEFSEQIIFPIQQIGYGIGQRDISEVANVLRVYLSDDGREIDNTRHEESWMVECNIDDMNPEWFDYLFQKLFDAGASDVFLTPDHHEKVATGQYISVLCNKELLSELKSIIFNESTSIGLREYPVTKTILERTEKEIETELGKVRIKSSYFHGREIHAKPEFEDLRKLAKIHGLSLCEVEKVVQKNL